MPPITPYTQVIMDKAVHDVLSKVHTVSTAAEAYGVPLRTLRKHLAKANPGVIEIPTSFGRPPILPRQYEEDLATWVVGIECDGKPVGYREIVQKANEILDVVHDTTNGTNPTSESQTLSKPRNAVDKSAVEAFYRELSQSISLVDMDPSRVFNMDETSFSPTKSSRKVVVQRTSKDVFVEEATASAHVTIVACVSAAGTKILPLFVLPGDRVSTEACDSLTIPGAVITTSEKGWTSSFICRK
ncbi:hypothetical protein AaE_002908 [Aphanomyces astaci]|uniref:HTH psq-type domain-containing protein n=1 Tax=Aphanomyces astaci TaxID=112090 RepID=A0A6A5AEF9_APHAT|nr:hypothetical protein AaE_002908 [Aphanomyces astaci]